MKSLLRLIVPAFALLAGLIVGVRADEAKPAGPDLTGMVYDPDGKPLAGATVFIYTAAPKKGVGVLCPFCYADCQKRATTGTNGQFKIENLDSNLVFRVLVTAKGREPMFIAKVDPAVKTIDATLKPSRPDIAPDHQVRGRITGQNGAPVAGAVVSVRSVQRDESTRFGSNNDVDPETVTDDDGRFVLNGTNKFDAAILVIEARGFAPKVTPELATGGEVHEIHLTEGASLKGRLVKDGQPVAGVKMGVSGAMRNAEVFVGNFEAGTDQDGRFTFVNLPPRCDFLLYATMDSIRSRGATMAQMVHVEGNGSSRDVGDVKVGAGYKLQGQIVLSDGKPVPPKTRVILSREEARDSTETKADKQGRFQFAGVPSEPINVSVPIKGYHLSARNKNLDTMNPFWLSGLLTADKTNLVVRLDPGNQRIESSGAGNYVDLSHTELRGAENGQPGHGDIHIIGKVVDSDTGQSINDFLVIEGRSESWGMGTKLNWMANSATDGMAGRFEMYLNKGANTPEICVAAKGYLPQASELITSKETNLNFALKKGPGPNGVILKPDGRPEGGAPVYLVNLQNGVYVDNTNMTTRREIWRELRSTNTDSQGNFSFDPQIDDYGIVVLTDDGYAEVATQDLAAHPEIKLQPWARVEGQLMIGRRPGANESIHLYVVASFYSYYPRDFSPLSLYLETRTDAAGHFSFARVPPVGVDVNYAPQLKGLEKGPNPEAQELYFSLKPGETKTIALGGKGRPVIGKIVINGYDGTMDWGADLQSLELDLPPLPLEEQLDKMMQALIEKLDAATNDNEKQKLSAEMDALQKQGNIKRRDFYRSEEGRKYFSRNRRYDFNCNPDGTFRIEDVLPGKYNLRISFHEGDNGPGMRMMSPEIASLYKEVTIPGPADGYSDKPFDLGTLELQSRNTLAVGKLAPDFDVKTIDGKNFKLSDYAGKYVLVDFWATWCGPCRGETPNLKAAYDAYKDDPRFRMIGLSLDTKTNAPGDYAGKNHLGWTMGFLGDWSKADLPNQYGVYGIPSIFLIGPDRKIIARDLRGDAIKAAVDQAMAKN